MTSTTISDSLDRETVRSASKVLLAGVSLVFVLYLVTLVPGIDRLVPQTPVTFAALASAVVTVVLVTLLLSAAPKLASLARMGLDGPRVLVENVASVVYWLVVLAAVLVAHSGLAGLVTPVLDEAVWLYDVAFLLAALPAVAVVAARLYSTLDPGAELVAERVAGGSGADEQPTGEGSASSRTADSSDR
ncbi:MULTISPECIES: hypothetical protein [Salinibaculum]|uniref:hypothetical protein n=1 Tax=Salinibaculum TaxID=2732368 RepID=UPI0030D23341